MAKLLSSLPVGAKVKFGKYSVNGETAQSIIWLIVAKNHTCTPAYPTNSVTLLTEKAIDMRAFDATEPTNTDSEIASYGNNYYPVSNLDQWLNKSASDWYSPAHTYDTAPANTRTGNFGTAYDTRPAFLNAFSTHEINAILNTNIEVPVRTGGYNVSREQISRKVFLASWTEMGYSATITLGAKWEYFSSNSKLTSLTHQAYINSLSTTKPTSESDSIACWTRNIQGSSSTSVGCSSQENNTSAWNANSGRVGVRPALNLSNTLAVSEVTDSDGCYTVIVNTPPPSPTTLTVPSTIHGGKSNAISWDGVTDPDGDTVTYQLECSLDGADYEQVYSGSSTYYYHLVPFRTASVTYRVKALDPMGESSAYTTSATLTVINNNAPVISGSDSNLGVKSAGFSGTYTITDADNNAVTVTEAIDGVQIRAFVTTLGTTNTYGITENTWLTLANGTHTLTIRATDGMDTSVRTYTFTKLVESFTIQNSTPWSASVMPTRIMLVVTRNIPTTSTFKVEVCNNGYDSSPTWEDCTDTVISGLIHIFTNKTKTASNWGVKVRVTVGRNGATGACYISAIGGNFE